MRVSNKAERVALNNKHTAKVARFDTWRKPREESYAREFRVHLPQGEADGWAEFMSARFESDNINCEE